MIITILKTWVESHVWLKLATIENDLGIPKKFLTSEMQDSKALVKACFALQDYGFEIPHVNIISVTETETEMMVEYSLEGIDTIGCNHKNFIRNVEMFLVKKLK